MVVVVVSAGKPSSDLPVDAYVYSLFFDLYSYGGTTITQFHI